MKLERNRSRDYADDLFSRNVFMLLGELLDSFCYAFTILNYFLSGSPIGQVVFDDVVHARSIA